MLLLVGIAFVAGVITAISPCVLPVLPIVLAGGAAGGRRRPVAIAAGLALSFTVFTLFAAWILDQLGLPKDLLRNIAIGLLFLIAASLVVPELGELLERPFRRFSRVRADGLGGGFLLGVGLGLVFVPCAGPILTFITVGAATLDFGWRTVVIACAYSLGAASVLLVFALLGQRAAERTRGFREHAREVRAALGVVIAAAALLIVFDVDRKAQTALGDYTGWFQEKTEKLPSVDRELAKLRSGDGGVARAAGLPPLEDFGPAPEFTGISHWLNTPDRRPLWLAGLRGKVVLVDFWTYSCINCLRTLPYVEAWDRTYRKDGLVVVGVHTPEFAFEHELSNVRAQSRKLGVHYAVALDNDYGTWNAYGNKYWPAKYLIDRRGHVRFAHFGEGDYGHTESLIRRLLAERVGQLPGRTRVSAYAPEGALTPETYLGYERISIRYSGSPIVADRVGRYDFPKALDQAGYAYAGLWRVGRERIVAGPGARLEIRFYARKAHLVLGGKGTVEVFLDGKRLRHVHVTADRLYTLVDQDRKREALLELRFSPNVKAYAFTFG
jgi:cytochrome c biogenesis protein CcdA/thiol-disulfide isomerase/thioredoxin